MIKFNPGETKKTIFGVKSTSYIKDTPPKTIIQSTPIVEEEKLEEKIDTTEEKTQKKIVKKS